MSEKVRIGFVCGKGSGHIQLAGEIDYGVCGSKKVADIYVLLEEADDLYPEYRDLVSTEEVAEHLEEIVNKYDVQREKDMWDNYDKS